MTTADEDRIMLRRAESVKWRIRGLSFSQIAEKTGVSKKQAFDDVKAALQESAAERSKDIEESRELELRRLDNTISKVTDILEREIGFEVAGVAPDELCALLGDSSELVLKAADRLVKLSAERSKLLGLYAPTKQEVQGSMGVSLGDLASIKKAAEANECKPSTETEPNS
jgi:hypothetical protein